MKKIERLLKYTEGGKVVKLDLGAKLQKILNDPNIDYETWQSAQRLKSGMQIGYETSFSFNGKPTNINENEVQQFVDTYEAAKKSNGSPDQVTPAPASVAPATPVGDFGDIANYGNIIASKKWGDKTLTDTEVEQFKDTFKNSPEDVKLFTPEEFYLPADPNSPTVTIDKLTPSIQGKQGLDYTMSPTDAAATILALNATDQALMGDKNFSAGSQALDSVVHGASGALMKSGNPWAMGAAVALEGLNFITKAGGRTVQGYDVNILNSGYGNMGHQESESGRIWDKWSGATARKLARRNEQARMALSAMDISEDQAFLQEARQNSVTNILQLNQIALAGGIDTSLLGS